MQYQIQGLSNLQVNMAVYSIKVLEREEQDYTNNPAIGFYNVVLTHEFYEIEEERTEVNIKKINSETLLRDIIKRDGSIVLDSNSILGSLNYTNIPASPATIHNPNELSNVAFILKEAKIFQNDTTSEVINSIPPDLFLMDGQPLNISTIGNINSYPIQSLNKFYIDTLKVWGLHQSTTNGYVDLYYNFSNSTGNFSNDLANWSILRVQIIIGKASGLISPQKLNVISCLNTDYLDSLITEGKSHPLEIIKANYTNGQLIPMNDYSNIDMEKPFLHYINVKHFDSTFSTQGNFNFKIDNDGGENLLNGEDENHIHAIRARVEDFSYNKFDTVLYEGRLGSPIFNGNSNLEVLHTVCELEKKYIELT